MMNWLARLFCRKKEVEIAVLNRSLNDMHSRLDEAIAERDWWMEWAIEFAKQASNLEDRLNDGVRKEFCDTVTNTTIVEVKDED